MQDMMTSPMIILQPLQNWTTGLLMFLTTFEKHADKKRHNSSLQVHVNTWQSNCDQCVTRHAILVRSTKSRQNKFQSYRKTHGMNCHPVKIKRSRFQSSQKPLGVIFDPIKNRRSEFQSYQKTHGVICRPIKKQAE